MFDMRRQQNIDVAMPEYMPGMATVPTLAAPEPDQMLTDFLGDDILDAEFQSVERPIELEGEDLQRFIFRFRRNFENSKSRMHTIHTRAKRDREIYRMLPREPEYEGGPDITTPLSANKADGVFAHIRDAIEQRPLATFSAEGVGKAAEEATAVAPVCAAYLEREINRSGSREKLAVDMARESVQVGTSFATLGVAEYPDEQFVQVSEIIRLENVFVDRVNVTHLRDTFFAYEYKERLYNLEEQAEMGLLDEAGIDKLRAWVSSSGALIQEEELYDFSDATAFAEENTIHTLVKGYMRFRPSGERKAKLFECVYHTPSFTILALRENPARHAFDAPPIIMHRIGKQAGYLFGRGIMERLRAEQKMADAAINNHLAMSNLAANPPVLYRKNSPFGQALAHNGRGGMYPGMLIPTLNTPEQGDVKTLDFKYNGLNLTDMQIAFGFADQATYTEEAIGSSSDPRKTLGQFQTEVNRGTMRVRIDVGDYAYDAATSLRMYWAMMVAYKIDREGVVEIEEDGKLLGAFEVEQAELEVAVAEQLYPMVASGEISHEEALAIADMHGKRLTNGRIPSARRNNLTISLTGTKVIADKVAELAMLERLTPYITTLIQAAAEDSYINYHMRSIIIAMGFRDVEKRIPADPGQIIEDENRRNALLAMMNEFQVHSTQR
jgi:hypothetical protein